MKLNTQFLLQYMFMLIGGFVGFYIHPLMGIFILLAFMLSAIMETERYIKQTIMNIKDETRN